MTTQNDQIEKCGFRFLGHYNTTYCQIIGTDWCYRIPTDRISEFCKLFPEINWEDGAFIEELKGKYIKVIYNDDMSLNSFKHIVKEIEYII